MSEQTFQDEFIDIEALLEELQNLPPVTEPFDFFTPTNSEPGAAYITKELDSIYSGFIGQFLMPDTATYISLYQWLTWLVDPGLRTAEHRKQIVDTLELATVVFENFVSVALKLERIRDPLGNYPTDSSIRTYLTSLIDQCLASPDSNDISLRIQKLKSMIEEREAVALATLASETKWLFDIWGPDLSEAWLSDDIPDTALDIVAQGLPAASAPAPISTEISAPLHTTSKLTRSYSVLDTKLQQPAKSTRPLTASQSFNVLQTSDSRPQKSSPKRGVPLSRTRSLSTILPPRAQHRVMTALETVAEGEQ